MYNNFLKPFADFFCAAILLILLSPIILVTILLLAIANKGKIFFIQARPGLDGQAFKIIKFKTMRDVYDDQGNPLPDEVRLTKIGNLVRSASLDELL